ncbi:flagellar biosynthetic protein FlhB [Thermodesulfatator indicus DSM 15286]|uniref:Flagellar biosynthetic protein FlhB n=1 Tax=Thermodesulfatator indicus (strain DSM 15286 / JCM 11887 / CIR29812) TaxID=667014 RepID=F8A9D0_THEID|nr:flagellar biosynthesis protein FlhB [Thermodesulfatator indicus]AEH44071.1 flagellar biosynthetic protein FlhB [Thermodesulfatator indicus DSM 15286]
MPDESLQEKTEEPTPRRREEARRRGQVAKSREITAVAVLSGSMLVFTMAGTYMVSQILVIYREFFIFSKPLIDVNRAYELLVVSIKLGGKVLMPLLIILLLVSFLSAYLQVGSVAAWEALKPKGERIDPIKGFKRLFSLPALFEFLKSLIKLIIISLVAYLVLMSEKDIVLYLAEEGPAEIGKNIYILARSLVFKTLMALAVLAILDFLFQRWETNRQLRMTKQELKEELKQTEGDPWVKSKIRQIQRTMAQRRMMAEVPKADVVITNPVHYAVALKYQAGEMPAPQVLAKGEGLVAQRIKEVAEEAGVPIVENPPLAQALYKEVEIGEYVPAELYQAVAEVLAYVYRLKGKVS